MGDDGTQHRDSLPSLREDLDAMGRRMVLLEDELEVWKGRWAELDRKLDQLLELVARLSMTLAERGHHGHHPPPPPAPPHPPHEHGAPPSWWPRAVRYRRGVIPAAVVIAGGALAVALERFASKVLP